jgi:hypothetical protein
MEGLKKERGGEGEMEKKERGVKWGDNKERQRVNTSKYFILSSCTLISDSHADPFTVPAPGRER